jgi:hypothetical protein
MHYRHLAKHSEMAACKASRKGVNRLNKNGAEYYRGKDRIHPLSVSRSNGF